MDAKRRSADILLWLTVAAGLPCLALALVSLASAGDTAWAWLALLTAGAGLLAVRIPLPGPSGHSLTVAAADCFAFVGFILFGVDTGVALAAVAALTICLRVRIKRLERYLFNVAQFSLTAWLVGHLYHALAAPFRPDLGWTLQALLAVALCGVVFFVLNSGLVAAALALSRGDRFFEFWNRYFVPLSPHQALNLLAALAFLLSVSPDRSLLVSLWLAAGTAAVLLSNLFARRWSGLRQTP